MTKTVLKLALLLLVAFPLFAQTSEFGFSLGGVQRRASTVEKDAGLDRTDFWNFSDSAKEIYYAIQLEPGTRFKLKAGEVNTSTVFVTDATITDKTDPARYTVYDNGRIEHVEGILDYRFSEPFGSTGLFAGAGMYRATGGNHAQSDFGLSFGVNGDFPINPRFGVVVEGAYHMTRLETHTRFITATAGLRVSF
jgi:hypothetical protein